MSSFELSRPLSVDQIDDEGITMTVEADAEERAALAARFRIPAVASLKAEVVIRAHAGGRLYLARGSLTADVVQSCVVSLEPVPAKVEERFAATFHAADAAVPEELAETGLNADPDWDDPEPVEDGVIDVGELVAQHLSLALDPYPRASGVSMEAMLASAAEQRETPFAILKSLKQDEGS